MTRFDDKIQLNGSSVEIHRDTGSVEDDYGDVTPIWGKIANGDEYVWIQKMQLGGNEPTPAGIVDEANYIGFFQSDTLAQVLDMVIDGSLKYEIMKMNHVTMIRDETSHYEGPLRLVEEG